MTIEEQMELELETENGEGLPEGWVGTTLGELMTFSYGKALPDRIRSHTGYPVYGSNGIVGKHAEPLTNNATIIIGRKGSVGEVNYSGGPCSPIDTTYFVDDLNKMPFRYWFHQLKSLPLAYLNKSTAIPGLNREDAYGLSVSLPPLPEQLRIVDKLDTLLSRVEAGRERLERVPKLIKRFRQSVLSAAVSGELTREWRESKNIEWASETCRVGDMGAVITGGTPKQEVRGGTGSVPFFKPSELDSGYWVTTAKELVTEAAAVTVRPIPDRTVMVTCIGATIGKTGLSRAAGITNQQINSVVCDEKKVFPEYLFFLMTSKDGQDAIIDNASSTTLPILNKSRFSDIEFELPPLPEQLEIVRRVESLFAFADRLEARYASALSSFNRLTPALLAKAFRGELVPQDPNDEPASVLLERIRAQRAATGPKAKGGKAAKAAGGEAEPRRRGRPAKGQAEADAENREPKRRGRPPGTTTIPETSSVEDAIRTLETQKLERAQGTRQVSLFGTED